MAPVFEYHAQYLRWIMFDKRGTGLSDPLVDFRRSSSVFSTSRR